MRIDWQMMDGGILFDLDGVLYNSQKPIPGAVEAIQWVQAKQIPHLFVTNTTSRSRAGLAEKLAALGFHVSPDRIVTPAVAASQWLAANQAVANQAVANQTKDIALFVRPATQEEFHGLPCLPDDAERGASYVIVGDLGELWDYRTLNRAFRLLHYNSQAVLIALGMTRYWQTEEGVSLDVAPFIAALEYATGRKAVVFGKPAAAFFQAAVDRLGIPASKTLMIGDDIVTDVGGAQATGLRGALVRTGKFRPLDVEGSIKPDFTLDSVADLPGLWESI